MEEMKTVAGVLLSKRHNKDVPLKGIIHVGAAKCEEREDYERLGVERILWIEGNALTAAISKDAIKDFPHQYMVEVFLSHQDGTEPFYETMVDSANDSLMKPCTWYEEVAVRNVRTVNVKRLDTLFRELGMDVTEYNTLVLDVQGAELKVLIGCGDILNHVDFVISEAWYDELYIWNKFIYENGTPLLKLASFLEDFYGLRETERTPTEKENAHRSHSWLDVLFERK